MAKGKKNMPTIRIVFRGLMVFNKQTDRAGKDYFEIGILDARPSHVPRIMTFFQGIRKDTRLLEPDMNKPPKLWELQVEQPLQNGISTRQAGSGVIDRHDASVPPDDFRWIIDLEDSEFPYGNIDQHFHLNRMMLPHVLRINNGEFFTRLKSDPLFRHQVNGTSTDFGAVAGVIGCDINVNGGKAKLVGADPANPIFEFDSDANLSYEFSNSPPDTAQPGDHFGHYYHLFKTQPPVKFGFENPPGPAGPAGPGPNPALCGKIYLSQFDGTLT